MLTLAKIKSWFNQPKAKPLLREGKTKANNRRHDGSRYPVSPPAPARKACSNIDCCKCRSK